MKHMKRKMICAAFCAAGVLSGCGQDDGSERIPEPAAYAGTTVVTTAQQVTQTEAETETTVLTAGTEPVSDTAATTGATTAGTDSATQQQTSGTAQADETTARTAESVKTTETARTTETTKVPEKTAFSTEQLTDMALRYYGSRTNHIPQFIDADPQQDGTVALHLYDLIDGHTATAEWYFVDRMTGSGKDYLEHPVALDTPEAALWNPTVSQRGDYGDNVFCGVLYLGNFPEHITENININVAFRQLIIQGDFLKDYPWISDIEDLNCAETEGKELYLIIPRDDEAHVVIRQYDPFEQKEYGRIFSSYNGAPILLRCNQSEVASDVKIQITDNAGEHPAFSPYISGRDGNPLTDCDKVKILNQTE